MLVLKGYIHVCTSLQVWNNKQTADYTTDVDCFVCKCRVERLAVHAGRGTLAVSISLFL